MPSAITARMASPASATAIGFRSLIGLMVSRLMTCTSRR